MTPEPLHPPCVDTLLAMNLGLREQEQVVLLTDAGTDGAVVAALLAGIERRGAVGIVVQLPRAEVPGTEPPSSVAALLAACSAGIELTSTFIGSSAARRNATERGVRYLAMPAVVASTFRAGGPLDVDFDALRATVESVAAAWGDASQFRLTTPAGTDLRGSVAGRGGRALHGIARDPGQYMAPPDIEAGTAPVEQTTDGVAVIDGDFLFMGPGPVDRPAVLHIARGQLVGVEGDEAQRLVAMMERCGDPRLSNLAEVSVGLNPNGRICGVPMETEATLGSAHIAFGNSLAYGGTVDAVAHLDCVMREATLELDGRPVLVAGRPVTG